MRCAAAVRNAASALGYSDRNHERRGPRLLQPRGRGAHLDDLRPCAGGLSHNEAESASAADLAAGADVLFHAMLSLANEKSRGNDAQPTD